MVLLTLCVLALGGWNLSLESRLATTRPGSHATPTTTQGASPVEVGMETQIQLLQRQVRDLCQGRLC